MTPDKKYKDLHSVLKTVLQEYNLTDTLAKRSLFQNWKKIAGKNLSDVCDPVDLIHGELTIKAKNKIWKEELALRQHDLLNLLVRQIGSSFVKKIKII